MPRYHARVESEPKSPFRVHGTGPVKKDNNNYVRLQSDQMRVEDGEGGEVQKVEGR